MMHVEKVYPRAARVEAAHYDGSGRCAVQIIHWAGIGKVRAHDGILQVETRDGEVVEISAGDWVIKHQDDSLTTCAVERFFATFQQEG